MSDRLFGWLTINQMLFVSHLVLVMSIILGMTYSRYDSEWNLRVEQTASIAKSQFTSQLTWLSTSVAGRNYANLLMPTTRETIWGIEDLLFMEISGISDYQNKNIGVRYLKELKRAWRTDVTQQEVDELFDKQKQLVKEKQSTPEKNKVRHKKIDYLLNKREKDIDVLNESINLNNTTDLLWAMPVQFPNGFALDEGSNTLHIKVDLRNRNGGQIWAVFDARDLESLKTDLLAELVSEAAIATLISLVVIYGVTIWIVSPLKGLASSMKQDIERIDIKALPEIKRNDEIGDLARSYSGLITKIGNQLKVLQKMSDTDPLTGLGSRYKYNRTSESFIKTAFESGKYVCVLICDIDNFKAYNDNYGHTDGDNTLCSVADAIENALGNKGIAYRFGGEEFVVLAKSSSAGTTAQLVHSIHQEVEKLSVPHIGNPPFNVVTISIGAVIIPPDVCEHADIHYAAILSRTLERADKKLYLSKDRGRNQVVMGDFSKPGISTCNCAKLNA